MLKKSLALFLMLFAGHLHSEHHKIQILLTNPRTVSTAFEKSIIARGDHKVFHEPWVTSHMYHSGMYDIFSQMPSQEILDAKNYEDIKALIYRYAAQKPVFVKDMVWCMGNDILHDEALLSDPDVVITFLIRNPAASIESWFLKGGEKMSFEQTFTYIQSLFRYDDLVQIAQKHRDIRGKWPIIVEAEELCRNPEETMKAYCKQAGISYMQNALVWNSDMPEEWKHLGVWHLDAAESRAFYVPKRDELPCRFMNTPEAYISKLEAIYQEQNPYYEMLKTMKNEE